MIGASKKRTAKDLAERKVILDVLRSTGDDKGKWFSLEGSRLSKVIPDALLPAMNPVSAKQLLPQPAT